MRLLPSIAFVAIAAVTSTAMSSSAFAQSTQGRWECHGAASADPTQPAAHGLLTIFGQSYTYASSGYQDGLSGGGSVEQQESGIAFADGPLVDTGGVEIGQIQTGTGTVAMALSGAKGVLLTCLAM